VSRKRKRVSYTKDSPLEQSLEKMAKKQKRSSRDGTQLHPPKTSRPVGLPPPPSASKSAPCLPRSHQFFLIKERTPNSQRNPPITPPSQRVEIDLTLDSGESVSLEVEGEDDFDIDLNLPLDHLLFSSLYP
jgi:hypothetical protein